MKGIKRLIFDFDNTLIVWKDKYLSVLGKMIKEYKLDVDLIDFDNAINRCSDYYGKVNKHNMVELARILCGVKITEYFIEEWFSRLAEVSIELEDDIKETLEYLSSKYDLVVFSNFPIECQEKRAENAGIKKYFTEFYGAEKSGYMKPHHDGFLSAIGNYSKEECIMIGDNLKEDIIGAISFGIKAIFLDRKDNIPSNEIMPYVVIKRFSDLKNIL